MPVPTYDKFIEPILRHLATHPEGVPARDVHEAAAVVLGLTDGDREELLPSGVQAVYKNRSGWAHDRLKRAGLSASPRRGGWQLTAVWISFARSHPSPLADDLVEEIATGNEDVRLRPAAEEEGASGVPTGLPALADLASPDEPLEIAVAELRATTSCELLETLCRVSPKFFETIVLDVTTSAFTAQAVEFANSVERLVLVDGKRLADLMIDNEVGVTLRPVRVPKLDTDYFDEE